MIFAICWFTRDSYRAMQAAAVDADKLPATYEDWLQKAEALTQHREGLGDAVLKVDVDMPEFVAWCAARGLKVDADARKRFPQEVAMRKFGGRN